MSGLVFRAARHLRHAFLAASRAGDFNALLTVLDPEIVFRIDGTTSPKGVSREVRGSQAVARQFSGRAQGFRTALVNGAVALIVAPRGHLFLVLNLTIRNGKIAENEPVGSYSYHINAFLYFSTHLIRSNLTCSRHHNWGKQRSILSGITPHSIFSYTSNSADYRIDCSR